MIGSPISLQESVKLDDFSSIKQMLISQNKGIMYVLLQEIPNSKISNLVILEIVDLNKFKQVTISFPKKIEN